MFKTILKTVALSVATLTFLSACGNTINIDGFDPTGAPAIDRDRETYERQTIKQPPSGQNPAGKNPSGQNPVGQNPVGQNPVGQNPVGQNPVGQNPVGQNPAGQNPAGQNPVGQNPVGQNPAGQNPAGQNPVGQNPAGQTPPKDTNNPPTPPKDTNNNQPPPPGESTDDDPPPTEEAVGPKLPPPPPPQAQKIVIPVYVPPPLVLQSDSYSGGFSGITYSGDTAARDRAYAGFSRQTITIGGGNTISAPPVIDPREGYFFNEFAEIFRSPPEPLPAPVSSPTEPVSSPTMKELPVVYNPVVAIKREQRRERFADTPDCDSDCVNITIYDRTSKRIESTFKIRLGEIVTKTVSNTAEEQFIYNRGVNYLDNYDNPLWSRKWERESRDDRGGYVRRNKDGNVIDLPDSLDVTIESVTITVDGSEYELKRYAVGGKSRSAISLNDSRGYSRIWVGDIYNILDDTITDKEIHGTHISYELYEFERVRGESPTWQTNNITRVGFTTVGIPTPISAVESQTAMATYTGDLEIQFEIIARNSNNVQYRANDLSMTVDFDENTIEGQANFSNRGGSITFNPAPINGNGFTGDITLSDRVRTRFDLTGNSIGHYAGNFFGPNAEDLAGVIGFNGKNGEADKFGTGGFRADRVIPAPSDP